MNGIPGLRMRHALERSCVHKFIFKLAYLHPAGNWQYCALVVKKEHISTFSVNLPLGSKPRLVNCGLAEHGLQGVERYELPKLWCLHLYFYKVEMKVAGNSFSIMPGAITLIPPGNRIVYKYTGNRYRHFYVHFATANRSPIAKIPLFQYLPQARDEMLDRLQNIQRILTAERRHAEILFWGLLWDIAESGLHNRRNKDHPHPLLKVAEQFIESRLPDKLTASDVAAHAGVCMAHMNRVVKADRGVTTIQLIKKYRLQRAYRLLIHSTMPVKLVARECGVEDLQRFNKLMRSQYGTNPRNLRTAHGSQSFRQIWEVERE